MKSLNIKIPILKPKLNLKKIVTSVNLENLIEKKHNLI